MNFISEIRETYDTIAKISLCLILLTLVACAPKVYMADGFSGTLPTSIALLPPTHDSPVARERAQYIQEALYSSLQDRGFVVLDQALVTKLCAESKCADPDELNNLGPELKAYGVQALAQLHLNSTARNNFLAGYYNSVRGELVFKDFSGSQLLRVQHGESERGGLLFNSGQIFQGIISQVRNSGDDAFGTLAQKFVRAVANKVPNPSSALATQAIFIETVRLERVNTVSDLLCVRGTPQSSAYLVLDKIKTNLREVRPGEYCGIYRLSDFVNHKTNTKMINVELRSPFGDTTRKEVPWKKSATFVTAAGEVKNA